MVKEFKLLLINKLFIKEFLNKDKKRENFG